MGGKYCYHYTITHTLPPTPPHSTTTTTPNKTIADSLNHHPLETPFYRMMSRSPPSSEIQGQIVGTRKKSKWAGKNSTKKSSEGK